MAPTAQSGRHRLGTLGLVHCVQYREVAEALADYRRNWLVAILVPARHSFAGLRRAGLMGVAKHALLPATG